MYESNIFDKRLAYLVLRLSLGINIFLHGAIRIFWTGAGAFVENTVKLFADAPLSESLVRLYAWSIPFSEVIVGVSIILGLLTRWGLFFGGLLMTSLIFGTALRSDWGGLSTQMIYAAIYYLMLIHHHYNFYSLDALIFGKNGRASEYSN